LFFAQNIRVNNAAKDCHGNASPENNGVVKAAEIELITEFQFRFLPQTIDGGVANFVATRLSRPRAVTVDFAAHFFGVGAIVFDEPLIGLFAGPAFRV
jgi:hypothetical protein